MKTETARVAGSFRAAAHAFEAAHALVQARRRPPSPASAVSGPGDARRDGGPAQAGRFLWLDDPTPGPRG